MPIIQKDPRVAALSQIVDAYEHYEGFGDTGEFTLARREQNSIVFVLRHRHGNVERPEPLAFDSKLAEPMRRALPPRVVWNRHRPRLSGRNGHGRL